MADPMIVEHFKAMFASPDGNRNLGRLAHPNATADAEGCRGGRDHLFLYLRIEDNLVTDVKFECATCDPAMLVTANTLCELVRGRGISDVRRLSKGDFFEALGGESEEIVDHCKPALQILNRAIEEYSQSRGIASDRGY